MFDGDGHRNNFAHGREALGDKIRLAHEARAERAGLYALGRTADIEVDLAIAVLRANARGVCANLAGSDPPSCNATGCSIWSYPSSRSRSPWRIASAVTISE